MNARDPWGATALLWAAQWDNVATAHLLIDAGAEVDAANDYGVGPLAMACTNASSTIVAALLDAGADPDQANPSGVTPLMIAARGDNLKVMKALLAHDADVGATERVLGQTAWMWAISEKQTDVARLLLQAGAAPRARSKNGFTPLMFAAGSWTTHSACSVQFMRVLGRPSMEGGR